MIDGRFRRELIDLAGLATWVYLNVKKRVGRHRAFEIMRVALLTGGTAARNLQQAKASSKRSLMTSALSRPKTGFAVPG